MAGSSLGGISVDPARPAPLAEQLRDQLTWLISSGDLAVGTALPSVRSMAADLGINLHTVRSAYAKLEADGLVVTRHGRGTQVAPFEPRRLWPAEAAARSHTVGVIVPTLTNPFFAALLQGLEEQARASGSLPIICTTQDDQGLALRSVAQLAAKAVDGLVVVSHDVTSLLVGGSDGTRGRAVELPLVAVDSPGVAGHAVEVDLARAAELATRHLLDHGHRTIGLVTVGTGHANTVPRERGYRHALQGAGLRPDAGLVARVDAYDADSGAAGARDLLARAPRPTAIVAIADLLAFGVERAAREAGLRIPDDLALVGVDDIPFAALAFPSLTTVALPAAEMGRQAMRSLDLIWAGDVVTPRKVVLETNLVIRESCGSHASP